MGGGGGQNVQGAKRPVGAKRPGAKRPGAKRPGGETSRGGNGFGAKRPGTLQGCATGKLLFCCYQKAKQ